MRTKAESRTLAKVLSILPAPKHHLPQFSTVKRKACKQSISAIFFGTHSNFIRAVPQIFCQVNRPKTFSKLIMKRTGYLVPLG